MNQRRIQTIIRKEWAETIRNRTIVGSFLVMLFVFTIMPLALAFGISAFGGEAISRDPDTAQVTALLAEAFPQFSQLNGLEQFQVFMLRQFLALFLLLPIMGSMSIATYSIIGEKTTRSLEALLATPIRTDELLLGKALAATVPTVLATWGAFGLFALAVRGLGGGQVFRYTLDAPAWAMMALMTPLITLFGLGLGVVVSSRANDPRSAQQVAGILVLPIIALMVGQSAGLFLLGLPLVIIGAVVLFLLDLGVLALGISLFQRETILTRWK